MKKISIVINIVLFILEAVVQAVTCKMSSKTHQCCDLRLCTKKSTFMNNRACHHKAIFSKILSWVFFCCLFYVQNWPNKFEKSWLKLAQILGVPKMTNPLLETKIRDHFYRPNTPPKPRKNHIGSKFPPLESVFLAILFILHISVSFLECKKATNKKCPGTAEDAPK